MLLHVTALSTVGVLAPLPVLVTALTAQAVAPPAPGPHPLPALGTAPAPGRPLAPGRLRLEGGGRVGVECSACCAVLQAEAVAVSRPDLH